MFPNMIGKVLFTFENHQYGYVSNYINRSWFIESDLSGICVLKVFFHGRGFSLLRSHLVSTSGVFLLTEI